MEKLENNGLANTGLVNTGLTNSMHRPNRGKNIDPKIAEQLEAQRIADRELVRGIFRYHETPGGEIGFAYRAYKADPLETYVLKDGETYTIPLGVAKHLNMQGRCDYPTYDYKNDESGRPVMGVSQRIRRMSFQNVDFATPTPSKKSVKADPFKSALPS